ncbi:MAG: RNA polymerase sigma factor [Bacillota bacterium]|nr:RNA polymerase sigma factor [Bacillota bacterium]
MSVSEPVLPDRDLVLLCRDGAENAYRALLDRHYVYVLKLCWRMTGVRDEAMDLTQEVFTRLITSLPRLQPQPSLRPWLRRVALNLCLSALSARRRIGQAEVCVNGQDGDGEFGARDRVDQVAQAVMARERLSRVAAAMQSLSPVQRAVVILKAVDGLSHGHIARILDLPQGTVKSHLSRARTRLRHATSGGE